MGRALAGPSAGEVSDRARRGLPPARPSGRVPLAWAALVACCLGAALIAAPPVLAADETAQQSPPAPTAAADSTAETPAEDAEFTETVTVTSTRLADQEQSAREVPASTTVITRAEIESSGARTVQELLSRVAGAIAYDQIGNAIQTTFDLRGFTGGGVTVLVDGARINDPRNNSVPLETISLDGVERIEIVRGAAAATVGGGSAAGVVNIVTRRGAGASFSGKATAAGGTYDTGRAGIDLSGTLPVGDSSSTRAAGGGAEHRSGTGAGTAGAPLSRAEVSSGKMGDLSTDAIAPDGVSPGGSAADGASPGGSAAGGAAPGGSAATGVSTSDIGAPAANGTAGETRAFDWFLSAFRDRTDGFRDNADARLTRVAAGAGFTSANGSRGALTFHTADDEIGAPGALTLAEREEDPSQAPNNELDNSDVSSRLGAFNWRGSAGDRVSLAANLSYLSRDSSALTTGRSAAVLGGFIFDSEVRTLGGALQSTILFRTGGLDHTLVLGGEGHGGTNDADGCGTSPAALDECDPLSFLNSSNSTERDDLAFFAQDSIRVGGNVTLLAGGRWDQSKFDYQESLPDAANDQSRTFSETTWKAGVAWNPLDALGLYASYGESFQPPTVEDLFAFPAFGSNPDLEPVNAENYEVGVRGVLTGSARASGSDPAKASGTGSTLAYAVAVFRTDLTNEIVFVSMPTPGNPFFGLNLNAAESRREGVEVTGDWRIAPWIALSLAYSRTRATFENGLNAGDDIPLVPKDRFSGSAQLTLPVGLSGRVDLLHVGDQVLVGDEANEQQRLDSYGLVDARVAWQASILKWLGLELFAEGRNLLDEEYATRGIYAPFSGGVFVTPAPGRTVVGGASLKF